MDKIENELIAEPKRLPELNIEYTVDLYLIGNYSYNILKEVGLIADYKDPRTNLIKKNT